MGILMGYNHNKNDDLGNKTSMTSGHLCGIMGTSTTRLRDMYIYITGHNGILMGYYLEINKIQVDIMEYS
jgi:hypothetical protein